MKVLWQTWFGRTPILNVMSFLFLPVELVTLLERRSSGNFSRSTVCRISSEHTSFARKAIKYSTKIDLALFGVLPTIATDAGTWQACWKSATPARDISMFLQQPPRTIFIGATRSRLLAEKRPLMAARCRNTFCRLNPWLYSAAYPKSLHCWALEGYHRRRILKIKCACHNSGLRNGSHVFSWYGKFGLRIQ